MINNDLQIQLIMFNDSLHETYKMLSNKDSLFTKNLDNVNGELIINSIGASFKKLKETLDVHESNSQVINKILIKSKDLGKISGLQILFWLLCLTIL